MSTKYVLFKREARHGEVVKSLKPLSNKVNVKMQRLPLFGKGLLSGSFPLSMITQGSNLPSQAEVRILYRPNTDNPSDGVLVATTTCNADGTWQVSGLNENLKFDIVARIPGFNDVIISDVQPTGAPLSAHFANLKEEYEYEEEVSIQVVALGGRPPYIFTAVELPEGLSIDPNTGYITGIVLDKLDLVFNVEVKDSENTTVNTVGSSYAVVKDPHWKSVISFLDFRDNTLNDQKGVIWTGTTPNILEEELQISSSSNGITSEPLDIPTVFTLEFMYTPLARASSGYGGHLFQIGTSADYEDGIGAFCWNSGSIAIGSSYNNNQYGAVVPIGVRTHIAICRYVDSTVRLFVGGVPAPNLLFLNKNLSGKPIRLGWGNRQWIVYPNSRFSQFRFTAGVARYIDTFDPPTEPFPNF